MSIVKKFCSLPRIVEFQGVSFEPIMYNNGQGITLAYLVIDADKDSPHRKMWEGNDGWDNPLVRPGAPYPCNFLWGEEGCETDRQLSQAIDRCKVFLEKHNLT